MPRLLFKLTALCLALIWMPVTLCCMAEAASEEAFSLCADRCGDDDGAEERDSCALVEDGDYSSSISQLKVPAPAEAACLHILHVARIADIASLDTTAVRAAEIRRPRDWVPIWQFERRAAAPAHAPDSSNA